ncbi:MAG: methionine sulfoxide reductase catalytic subunit [Acidobacteriota bacterium]|jgi:sulfoxide reductase catalytic subunit YedY|nr:methionine sulfoxide reductase catalytic subunit [Acidobacteriota bacterium]
MLIKKPDDIKSSEITPKKVYLNRRTFMRGAALLASTAATGFLYREFNAPPQPRVEGAKLAEVVKPEAKDAAASGFTVNEELTPFEDITSYNNFYEFTTDKRDVAGVSRNFITRPWTVAVEGLVNKPKIYDLDDLLKIAPLEERIYRLRCVEGWSMVIPWVGFSLNKLLSDVEPTSRARFVQFETLLDPKRMPEQQGGSLDWPYVEGLRLDEAMHPLTILASGLYGEELPPQDGAPIRLVVPWKYGFKSIKSIVKIRLVRDQPDTTWNNYASNEYGFYSNVNPTVDHPRWSQARETRIGEYGKRDTLMFNGYTEQVGQLYTGMDLRVNF